MKKLFVLATLCLAVLAWPAAAASKPAKSKAKPAATAPAPPPEAPAEPLPRKPGFWERAWDGTKSGSKKVWSATTRPFGGKSSKAKAGWRDLTMTIAVDPAKIKADTRSLRVKVTVANHGKNAVQLDFPSAQRAAIVLLDDAGKVRSKAVDVQKGDPEQGLLIINPDERLEYSGTLSARDLSAGQAYTIEAAFPDFPELHTRHAITPARE